MTRGEPPAPASAAAQTLPAERRPTAPAGQNRRLYRRVALQAEIEIDRASCRLVDLSMGGFAAAGVPPLSTEGIVPVTLRMTIDGIEIGTKMAARIVYSRNARIGGRFVELTPSQTAFLRYVVTWRGESVGAVGTTTLLDAITRRPERALIGDARPRRQGLISRWIGRLLGRPPED